MKKLAFLLAVFVLFLATIPCCLADNCPQDEAPTESTNKDKEPEKGDSNCSLCSPFFRCHSCNGFAFVDLPPKITVIFFTVTKEYLVFRQYFVSKFTPSIWQPPKIASDRL